VTGLPASDPRDTLARLLDDFLPEDPHEREMCALLRAFVRANPLCFERSLTAGHVTGSAWVIDPGGTLVLLTHHRKLNKWLQPGGHADGDPDVLAVALREVREESGLEDLRPLGKGIFDVDVHRIPARGSEAAHLHYDVRFLVEADPLETLRPSDESNEMSWLPLDRVQEWTAEESVLRMVRKSRR
jgi:8-oxo-dGTP pyrophosphatase MutT (NUDIX family)